ncbi:hypothetical protein G9A89_002582 [Geosiphon pyriformis]|nr:hypothetical protein G9A89_002582 [Geosiphon pyriformis]
MPPVSSVLSQTPRKSLNSTLFDMTGRKHIFKVRGDNYRSKRDSLNKEVKKNEEICCDYDEFKQYINTLEKGFNKIEQKLNYLTELSTKNLQCFVNNDPITNKEVNLSDISIDELLKLSINIEYGKLDKKDNQDYKLESLQMPTFFQDFHSL